MYRPKGKTGKLRSKVIATGELQTIVKNIAQGQPVKKIADVAYRTQLKEPLLNSVIKDVINELKLLSSTKRLSCLRKTSSDDLAAFCFNNLIIELQLNVPVLYKILKSLFEKNPTAIAVTAAIIMKEKNMHMSAFHHVVAQILDNGGTTDEVCMYI